MSAYTHSPGVLSSRDQPYPTQADVAPEALKRKQEVTFKRDLDKECGTGGEVSRGKAMGPGGGVSQGREVKATRCIQKEQASSRPCREGGHIYQIKITIFPPIGAGLHLKLLIVYLKLKCYCASCILSGSPMRRPGPWAHPAALRSVSGLTASTESWLVCLGKFP